MSSRATPVPLPVSAGRRSYTTAGDATRIVPPYLHAVRRSFACGEARLSVLVRGLQLTNRIAPCTVHNIWSFNALGLTIPRRSPIEIAVLEPAIQQFPTMYGRQVGQTPLVLFFGVAPPETHKLPLRTHQGCFHASMGRIAVERCSEVDEVVQRTRETTAVQFPSFTLALLPCAFG